MMTTKEMIAWFACYRGYTLSTGRKDSVQRRIIASLCNDIGYAILGNDELRRIKAKDALVEFCEKNGVAYPI